MVMTACPHCGKPFMTHGAYESHMLGCHGLDTDGTPATAQKEETPEKAKEDEKKEDDGDQQIPLILSDN